MFIEVNSTAPKQCTLIINMDYILEVAPLITGGCVISMGAQEAGTSRTITVSDDYSVFKQFVLQTVTAESIEKRFPKVKKEKEAPVVKPQVEGENLQINIPTFGKAE